MKKLLLVLLVIAIALYWYFFRHHHETMRHHAWQESQKLLPADLVFAGDLEAAQFGATPLAGKILKRAIGDDSFDDFEGWARKLGGTCKLDLLHALDSFVVAGPHDGGYVVIAALDRVDREDVDACMKKLGATVTELDHGIARYDGAAERSFVLRWFDDRLFAFGHLTESWNDPKELLQYTSGGFDKDKAMNALAAKVDRSWIGWVMLREAPLDGIEASGTFSLAIRGGDVRMAARAYGDVEPIKAQLDDLVALAQHWVEYGGDESAHLAPLVRALEVEADKDSAAITAHVTDDDVVRALFPAK